MIVKADLGAGFSRGTCTKKAVRVCRVAFTEHCRSPSDCVQRFEGWSENTLTNKQMFSLEECKRVFKLAGILLNIPDTRLYLIPQFNIIFLGCSQVLAEQARRLGIAVENQTKALPGLPAAVHNVLRFCLRAGPG